MTAPARHLAADFLEFARSNYFPIPATVLVAATGLLMWFGYRATAEWQRSTRLLVEQRTAEVVTLMITALSRDMRGVQSQVLPQLKPVDIHSQNPYELGDDIAKAFSRFPYPESFFSWTPDNGNGVLYLFNRADRPPQWYHGNVETADFPTTIQKDPGELDELVRLCRRQASLRTKFIVFETRIAGETYQIVARPEYGGPSRARLLGIIGFTVNIQWVRVHYFSELTAQLSRIIGGRSSSMAIEIVDENNKMITANRSADGPGSSLQVPEREQRFPLLFFDPVFRATTPDETLPLRYWTARAQAVEDQSMLAAASGARRTFTLISVASIAAAMALLLTVRAVRAATMLATMKSEFVSTVTHELKTPLSSIRLVSETLSRGRFRSSETVAEYAGVLLTEVNRLTRTVDNLLTMARVQDVHGFYVFESVDLVPVVEIALNHFQPQLKEGGFEVRVDIPAPLPVVRADRTALLQVLENLLDNAIRYSNGTKQLTISASASATQVSLRVADKGPGIPADELPHVFERFFRGHDVSSGGSGLGLAIAHRIIRDHHGDIRLQSEPGLGTTAEVILPMAAGEPPS